MRGQVVIWLAVEPASVRQLGYEVTVAEDEGGVWVATARRVETNDVFGPPVAADRAEDAIAQLTHWLRWQHDHMSALEALQAAAGAYHRLAVRAFADAGREDGDRIREALAVLETARRDLDQVRERKPCLR